jgi:hypothetical protein
VGNVKPFTDISGMHILRLSQSPASRNEFAKRLEDLGCRIDTDGDAWLRTGEFIPTPPRRKAKKK